MSVCPAETTINPVASASSIVRGVVTLPVASIPLGLAKVRVEPLAAVTPVPVVMVMVLLDELIAVIASPAGSPVPVTV